MLGRIELLLTFECLRAKKDLYHPMNNFHQSYSPTVSIFKIIIPVQINHPKTQQHNIEQRERKNNLIKMLFNFTGQSSLSLHLKLLHFFFWAPPTVLLLLIYHIFPFWRVTVQRSIETLHFIDLQLYQRALSRTTACEDLISEFISHIKDSFLLIWILQYNLQYNKNLQFTTFMTSKCTIDIIINVLSSTFFFICLAIKYNSFWINADTVSRTFDIVEANTCDKSLSATFLKILKQHKKTANVINVIDEDFTGATSANS